VASIVIPIYWEEKIIGSTLMSLKSQLTIPHEIIISDGGSKDQTVKIAAKYADKLVVYNGIKRQTIAHGRYNGVRVPQGEFLVLLDANSFIRDPDTCLRTAISNFDRVCNLVALTGPLRVLLESETVSDKYITRIINSLILIKNNFFHEGEVPGGEFQMIPRQKFAKVPGYDEELVTREDRDIFFRLSRIGRTLCDPRLTVFNTGRRAHHYGRSHIIGPLIVNTPSFHVRGRIRSKEWTLHGM
jgi:glycosyltransferase involved in cell wall biosynthesis